MEKKGPSKILSYLYLGNKSDAKSLSTLKSLNIKYILNCTPTKAMSSISGCPNYFEKSHDIVYKRIPIFDNNTGNLLVHIRSAYDFIEEGRHHGSVLVHCRQGISRSTSFVVCYLMRKNEFTLQEAVDYIQSIRPSAQPNESFLSQLESYEATLQQSVDSNSNSNSNNEYGNHSTQPMIPTTNTSQCAIEAGPKMPVPDTFTGGPLNETDSVSNNTINNMGVSDTNIPMNSGINTEVTDPPNPNPNPNPNNSNITPSNTSSVRDYGVTNHQPEALHQHKKFRYE